LISMQCFDLVAMDSAKAQEMAQRLGYKRIFSLGKDVDIVENLKRSDSARKKIVKSDDFEVVSKLLRQNEVIGMLPGGASVSKKTLEIVKNEGKLLFVPLADMVRAEDASRTHALVKARNLIRSALMSKVNICVVSMADDATLLMSNMQMTEVACFLGMDQARAKDAVCVLGGVL